MHPKHPMRAGAAPEWASAFGEDRYGLWAAFTVAGVAQRMRWLPPGTFTMGSPEDEPGRDRDEVEHEVVLTEGYWMADTPVTQALWTAVMGENPSRFVSPERPVEMVSWENAQSFIQALKGRVPGLDVRLPTEAQWEYACRAGTVTATYAGPIEIRGERDAPVLDDIAWYGGNSGVDFDLDDGHDSSNWSQKQYPHDRAGTRKVGEKAANDFGLFDTLGNVWEWCADWFGEYEGDAVDPAGPASGADRVIRGGSWVHRARYVRAAYRFGYGPGDRYEYLGFRLSRGQAAPGGRSAHGAPEVAERVPPWNGGVRVSGGAAVPEADPAAPPFVRRFQQHVVDSGLGIDFLEIWRGYNGRHGALAGAWGEVVTRFVGALVAVCSMRSQPPEGTALELRDESSGVHRHKDRRNALAAMAELWSIPGVRLPKHGFWVEFGRKDNHQGGAVRVFMEFPLRGEMQSEWRGNTDREDLDWPQARVLSAAAADVGLSAVRFEVFGTLVSEHWRGCFGFTIHKFRAEDLQDPNRFAQSLEVAVGQSRALLRQLHGERLPALTRALAEIWSEAEIIE